MNEIKFQGKRVDNGEWVVGFYVGDFYFEDEGRILSIDDKTGMGIEYEVDPATVGQFTGLKDKNRTEIYKGDVCKYFMDNVWKYGVVEWAQGGFAFRVFRMGEKLTNVTFKFQTFIPVPDEGDVMGDRFEVIGNRWDNPELLEVQP